METLFKISLTASITGILLLLFLTNILELKIIEIDQINEKTINKKVKISGEVFSIKNKETFTILSVKDKTGEINVLCECREIETNREIEIIGKVKEHKGTLQINADKILLSSALSEKQDSFKNKRN